MDSKTKDALKQLQSEIRQLQMLVTGKTTAKTDDIDDDPASKKGKSDIAVQMTVHAPAVGAESGKPTSLAFTELQIMRVTDEAAASVGYALASPQKIGLLRALLGKESESAATLGEAVSLSTGSLYHHLRELMRADLVVQSGRNRYVLSERGARVLLVTLALAVDA